MIVVGLLVERFDMLEAQLAGVQAGEKVLSSDAAVDDVMVLLGILASCCKSRGRSCLFVIDRGILCKCNKTLPVHSSSCMIYGRYDSGHPKLSLYLFSIETSSPEDLFR